MGKGARFGLYSKENQPIELLNLSTNAIVEGPYAEFQHVLTYQNPTNQPLETTFYFPRTDTSIFHKFEAVFRNRTIVGKILEKEQAKREYSHNLKRGHTVAYSERNSLSPDVMKVQVGNIPPGEAVKIIFSTIEPLELIINQFWGLKLPSVLTERYAPASVNQREVPAFKTVDKQAVRYPDWKVRVELKSDSAFSFLHNPSHKLAPQLVEPLARNSTGIFKAIWEASLVPEKDFVVYFKTEKLNAVNTLVATLPTEEDNHVLLINTVPQLNRVSTSDSQKSLTEDENAIERLQTLVQQEDVENAKGEFIFVIDRSGSMFGGRINNLKRALTQFLQILPQDSYFNIISFGSYHELYRYQSQKTSKSSLEDVNRWIQTIDANMGDTEIYSALQAATSLESKPGYPRIVVLLTDGDVYNPDQVIQHALEHSDRMRFCGIGIGYGVSEYLVKNMAKAGKCTSELVTESEDIGQKAAYIVKAAVSRYLDDISLNIKCMDAKGEIIYTEQRNVAMILKDQPLKEWVYLQGIPALSSCSVHIGYYNSLMNEKEIQELRVDNIELAERTDVWHKIAYDAKIREKDLLLKSVSQYNSSFIKQEIVGLSCKYQVLSSYTAFLAVIQENIVDPGVERLSLLVPNLKSADYTAYVLTNDNQISISTKVNADEIVTVDLEADFHDMACEEVDINVDVEIEVETIVDLNVYIKETCNEEEEQEEEEREEADGPHSLYRKHEMTSNLANEWKVEHGNVDSQEQTLSIILVVVGIVFSLFVIRVFTKRGQGSEHSLIKDPSSCGVSEKPRDLSQLTDSNEVAQNLSENLLPQNAQ